MTGFDEDHGLLLDERMMGAQVRVLYPCTLRVRAMLILERPGKHEDLLSTPVLVSNEALASGPMNKGGPLLIHRMKCLDSEVAVARKPGFYLSLRVHKSLVILSEWA